jgi:muramoyltetrapeptide carboxypeptidase
MGGCLDTIGNLVGTPYGDMAHFADTFRQDGIIVYLENCELSPCAMTRALWQMRMANWFDGVNGVVFGRSAAEGPSDANSLSYLEALEHCMKDLNIPIVYDADLGHKPPNLTLINGAMAELSVANKKATLKQTLV